ncbi:hypothetical protein SAMN05216298_0403 [Glycomyces sambucus]|uniref:Uncharacterized protein n=1 Tax=Glycomyces sambucus TaxID=380244 RepID=A0A1G9CLD3_9ACTN|nr:hypothetical protein [Glycomyces sambucus]SDK52503.1 hypothetical protein SAMN05216298_0403 [Glycomyces sambucus]
MTTLLHRLMGKARGRGDFPVPAELWPDTAAVELRRMRAGDGWAAVLVLVGYPASLPPGVECAGSGLASKTVCSAADAG